MDREDVGKRCDARYRRYWEFAEAARRTQESQFFKNLSIIGGFLLLCMTGSGRLGLDTLLRRWKNS